MKFIQGHGGHKKGSEHSRWKGGRVNDRGYVLVFMPGHPRADKKGYVYEHILVLEKMIGRSILRTECGHHLDGNRSNNTPGNLVLFATLGMHTKFHQWLRKLEAAMKRLGGA